LGDIEPAVNGEKGVVLRLDEIPPILPDHPELAVEVDRRDAELEGHDAVVLERDDHIPASVHIAPLSGQLALGQPLAVAPYRGPLRRGGGREEKQSRAQGRGQQPRQGALSLSSPHINPLLLSSVLE